MKQLRRATTVAAMAGVVALAVAAITLIVGRSGAPVLAADGAIPARGRLLWLNGRPTVPGLGTVAVRDSTGRVLLADDRLRIREAMLPGDLGAVVSVAPAAHGGLWAVDGYGRLRQLARDGATVREIRAPYVMPALGGLSDDGRLAVARSAEGFPFVLDTMPVPPVALLDTAGHQAPDFLGSAAQPGQPLLSDLANAGYVVRHAGLTLYAPFVRDEVVAFAPDGDTVWALRRGLSHETPDPRFLLRDGRPVLDYFPVNLGLGVGPDGRLYILSTADTSLTQARLDVLEPASGKLLATFSLPTVFPTIVVTRRGRAHIVSSDALLARAGESTRPAVTAFSWPSFDGDEVTQADLLGRVTIVNVWASWCAPCREEMPELVGLWRSLADSGLGLLAVNEDVRVEAARSWLREQGLEPPVVLARGAARRAFGYRGLPYTMLVARDGRIVRTWVGYLGAQQIDAIETAARLELGLSVVSSRAPLHHPLTRGRE